MKRLLIIWTARNLAACRQHFAALTGTDRVWIQGHTEVEVAQWITKHADKLAPYDTVSLCPDDAILSQQAYDVITQTCHRNPEHAASGWANIDFTHPHATVMVDPVPAKLTTDWYTFLTIPQVVAHPGPIHATWTGMACHTMTPTLWAQHPIKPHHPHDGGAASDHALAVSLQSAGRNIIVDPRAALMHLKVNHLKVDTGEAWKHLDLHTKRVTWEQQ
jgi:hypothetical protein